MSALKPWIFSIGLAALAVGFQTLGRVRESRSAADRLDSLQVLPLIVAGESKWFPADGERSPVAVLGLLRGRDTEFSYARSGGLWRCREHFGSIASEARIVGLMESVALANQLVAGDASQLEGAQLEDWGLDPANRTRISLHGPDFLSAEDRDELWAIDLGSSIPGATATGSAGCYARVVGDNRILELDTDLRALLADAPTAPGSPRRVPRGTVPPLLERRLIPAGWPGTRSGLQRIFVDRADGSGFELNLTEAGQVGPNGEPPVPRYRLTVHGSGAAPVDAHPVLSTGYTLFLTQALGFECVDPNTIDLARLDNPQVTITLQARSGPPLELRILRGGLGEAALVVDNFGQAIYRASDEVIQLLNPRPEQLTDPELGIAWDAYLR